MLVVCVVVGGVVVVGVVVVGVFVAGVVAGVWRIFLSMVFLCRFWLKEAAFDTNLAAAGHARASEFPPFRRFGRTGSTPPVLFKAPLCLHEKLLLVLLALAFD